MSLDRVVDEMIRDAMARGEFDNLPGAGKPQNLDSYFAAPEDLRMAWSVLRNAGYLPEEVAAHERYRRAESAVGRGAERCRTSETQEGVG